MVHNEVGLVVSVGVAPNKFLAKLASDLRKPDGLVVITSEEAPALLAELPVGKLWGVGKVTERELNDLGIFKIGDLFSSPPELLDKHLGSYADHLLELARGIDDREIVTESEPKSISAETTFAKDIADPNALHKHICILVERIARELRDAGYRARTVNLKARYADFTTVTRAKTLETPTAATRTIRETAAMLLTEKLGRQGRPLRLLGVGVSNLVWPGTGQLELFPDEMEEKAEALGRVLDGIKDRFGKNAITSGSVIEDP